MNADKISQENPVFIVLIFLSIIGIYDIVNEITQDYDEILSRNYVKKIMLFSAIYLKSSSIYVSSIVCIIFFLLFPKVFFGKQTSYKTRT
jgi:hypothetical protein